MKNKLVRIPSVLLAIVIALLIPMGVLAAPKDTGKLTVGDLVLVENGQDTGKSTNAARYHDKTNTLTLTDYSGGALSATDMGDNFTVIIRTGATLDSITAVNSSLTIENNGALAVHGNLDSDGFIKSSGDSSITVDGHVKSGGAVELLSHNGSISVGNGGDKAIVSGGNVSVSAPTVIINKNISGSSITLAASSLLTLSLGSNVLSLKPNSGRVTVAFNGQTPSDNKLVLPGAEKSGGTFVTWDSQTGENKYKAGDEVTITGNEMLVANWDKKVISIGNQPQSIQTYEGNVSGSMSVEATATDNSEISYLWYGCDDRDKNGATPIDGETGKSMNVNSSLMAGSYYYFCKLSVDGADDVDTNVAVLNIVLEPRPQPTATPTAEPTATPTAEPTATPTAEPTATPTAEPTATPTPQPTATPTPQPTATPTPQPTATPTPQPTATPTPRPTATPAPDPTPRPVVTPKPTPVTTAKPTPTAKPTAKPKATPTPTPTPKPSVAPTTAPSPTPPPSKGGVNPLAIALITGGVIAAAGGGVLLVRYLNNKKNY